MNTKGTLAFILTLLIGSLLFFDAWLSDDGTVGWTRNSVLNSQARWARNHGAKVAVFGSSTSRDWLPDSVLSDLTKARRGHIVDGHINGCHQGCTWAELEQIRQSFELKRCRGGRQIDCLAPKISRFDYVFFGSNLFQMCDDGHSKRNLQQSMLLPTESLGRLFSIYAHAENPLRHMARFLGMRTSHVYGDTAAVRDYWLQRWFGSTQSRAEYKWHHAHHSSKKSLLSCEYTDEKIALKRAFTEALFEGFSQLSKHSFIMLLPDKTNLLEDPEHQRRWARHRALYQELTDRYDNVHLLDLTGSVTREDQFRDGFHLKSSHFKVQQAMLKKEFEALRNRGALD